MGVQLPPRAPVGAGLSCVTKVAPEGPASRLGALFPARCFGWVGFGVRVSVRGFWRVSSPVPQVTAVSMNRTGAQRVPPRRLPATCHFPAALPFTPLRPRPNGCDSTPWPVLIFCMSEGAPPHPDRTVHRMCENRTTAPMRGWRNRQTRWIQVPVPERAWGFNSPLAHRRTGLPQGRPVLRCDGRTRPDGDTTAI